MAPNAAVIPGCTNMETFAAVAMLEMAMLLAEAKAQA